MEKEKILSRWYEYISELYNDDRGEMTEIVAEVESPIDNNNNNMYLKSNFQCT